MIVGELPSRELASRLANAGLRLRTGPVVNRIQSQLRWVVQGIARHYADYTIEESASFADFHVRLGPPRGLRRWLKPQVMQPRHSPCWSGDSTGASAATVTSI